MTSVKAYYDKQSPKYDDVSSLLYFKLYDEITWRYLEPYVPSSSEAVVLDAGGGTGKWTVQMARKGCRVVLLDLSEGMLNIAKGKISQKGLKHRVTFEKGDITKLKHADETFDMVFCEHALFLLDKPDVALKEFARVLKKGSPLIVSAQNHYVHSLVHIPQREIPALEKLDEAQRILLRKKYDSMTRNGKVKIYTWTPDEFRTLLEGNGFSVQKIIGKGVTMPLRITEELYLKKEFSKEVFNRILQLELAFCERQDALALAGHLQAIAYKV